MTTFARLFLLGFASLSSCPLVFIKEIQATVNSPGTLAVAHHVVSDLLVAAFDEEVVDAAPVHPVLLGALQTENLRQVVQLDSVPPVRERPHAVEHGSLSVPGEADVDARPDAPDHATGTNKMEVEIEEVEADEEVVAVVEVSDQLPEGSQNARLVEVEAAGQAVAPEHTSRDDFAVTLDDQADTEDPAKLWFES